MRPLNFVAAGLKFTKSFYLDSFQRYSRSKSKVVGTEFWTFFDLPSFTGAVIRKKVCPDYHVCVAARHVEKIREVTTPSPKVITTNTLNFKPIFECSLSQIVGRIPVHAGVCASKPWSFSSTCKHSRGQHPIGPEIWSSDFGSLFVREIFMIEV